ncbi:MAG TPA: tetratricopeptide repeat protein [Pyrinomonadaceae bacterium]|nr:tetratricopeptide repeat protein [Pyrinomonadaceae bacterium]
MKSLGSLLLLALLSFSVAAQTPGGRSPQPSPTPVVPSESERLEQAIAANVLSERIELLEAFISDFPESERLSTVRESLGATRTARAEEFFKIGDFDEGARQLRLAFRDAPPPWSDRYFADVISQLPAMLFFRRYRESGLEIAAEIVEASEERPGHLVLLSGFFLSIEDGETAKRLIVRAIASGADSADSYIALGMAERLNFDLVAAERAYAEAAERSPGSTAAIRGLADLRRATGKPEEALELYRRLYEANSSDNSARTGVVMSLFESGKRDEAAVELEAAISADPTNIILIASAAFWHAANNEPETAIELAGRAIAHEPRYIWSHIALARALIAQKRPVEAERVLLAARKYGNFPTVAYEIALARMEAGFFKEAKDELKSTFEIRNGNLSARLGQRIERSSGSFDELLAPERQASIFVHRGPAAGNAGERLKALLSFSLAVEDENSDEARLESAASNFIGSEDVIRPHRQIYAAARLLEAGKAPELAREIAMAATGGTETGLLAANPSAAVMADALYDGRRLAISRDQYVLVPEVPRQTLSAILRGRVEDLIGWSYLEEGNTEAAEVRLRRAISVLPERSIWWRESKWRLGHVLIARGEEKEALENYISGYDQERLNAEKYAVIESLYLKLNETVEGLEARIGPRPATAAAGQEDKREVKSSEPVETKDETDETEPVEQQKRAEEQTPPTTDLTRDEGPGKPPTEPSKTELPEQDAGKKPSEKDEPADADTDAPSDKPASTVRPRVVRDQPVREIEEDECPITISQEVVSIRNNGGSVGILVTIEGDAAEIRAVSSSPENVEVRSQPDIVGVAGRAFFEVRSRSTATGEFRVTFTTPCGTKQVIVRVR